MFDNHLILIDKPDDPPTYYSRAWRTTNTPDLATEDIARVTKRAVDQQLGGSDHKPIIVQLQEQARHPKMTNKLSWNFKRAK